MKLLAKPAALVMLTALCFCDTYINERSRIMNAAIGNEDGFSIFKYGDTVVRFKAPYSLEKYTKVKKMGLRISGCGSKAFS